MTLSTSKVAISHRERYYEFKAKGLCTKCGEPATRSLSSGIMVTRTHCGSCLKKATAHGKARYEHKRKEGKCTLCGKESLKRFGYTYCEKCVPKKLINVRKAGKKIYNARRVLVRQIKSFLSCDVCGESHPACLDFHHRNPVEKSFTISNLSWKVSTEKLFDEIAKCDILCANCHRKLHWIED